MASKSLRDAAAKPGEIRPRPARGLPPTTAMEKTSKIYIAGHRGLVGSAIWNNLATRGYTNLVGRTHAELDLTDQAAVAAFFDGERPEYVFLAAARVGGIGANNRYRANFIYDNLAIQNHIIHHAWRTGVRKLLFLGSTCIYPRDAPQPLREESLLTGPLEYTNEPYAIAKIAGIKLCESYNLQYGTDFVSVMPTNLYGPNDNFDLERSHVLPAILRKMHLAKALHKHDWDALRRDMARRPIAGNDGNGSDGGIVETLGRFGVEWGSVTLWGSGRPLREFLWSEDMADACVFVMENVAFGTLAEHVAVGNEIRNTHLNIGTGHEIAIDDLAALAAQTVGFTGEIRFDASQPDGTMRKVTDPSRLHALGWRHSVDIAEGIGRLYGWYCANQ